MDRYANGGSEAKAAAESGAFHVLVDVFLVDGLFDDFADGEGGVAGGVEVLGHGVEGSVFGAPVLDGSELDGERVTVVFLSESATLTMCPKVGTTLMLMLLRQPTATHPGQLSSGTTSLQQ